MFLENNKRGRAAYSEDLSYPVRLPRPGVVTTAYELLSLC
jgi:hypothetical protein